MSRAFAANHHWVVHRDTRYISRNLTPEAHEALALYVFTRDPELMDLCNTLGYAPIVAITIGQRSVHLRILDRLQMERRPDMLASRVGSIDPATFIGFDAKQQPYVITGENRQLAIGQSPRDTAELALSPAVEEALNLWVRNHQQVQPHPSRPLQAVG